MKYNEEQQAKINKWLVSVGAYHLADEEFYEYKDGQLLEIAETNWVDSLFTWDEWQHVQILMGMELPLDVAIRIAGVLWENNIEVRELKTEESEKYYRKLDEEKIKEDIKRANDILNNLLSYLAELKSNEEELYELLKDNIGMTNDEIINYDMDWLLKSVK